MFTNDGIKECKIARLWTMGFFFFFCRELKAKITYVITRPSTRQ